MSKRKAATASKHARSPKIAAMAQRANQAIVRSPKDSRLRSVTAVSSPKRHKDSKQEAPLVESPAAALPDDFKQTMRDNDSNKGFDFSSASSATASVRVASVEKLPAKLLEHQAYLSKVEERKGRDGAREDVLESLAAITTVLRKRLKHDFSGYKQNTMVRRIQRRMQVLQIEAVPAYAEHLRREPSEGDALFRELLIGVTQFFRDQDAFEALRANFLPSLLAAREAGDPIRVWVAGCASGEEVYSIAILLQEVIGAHRADAIVTIFGTDIDPQAIAFARAARFRRG